MSEVEQSLLDEFCDALWLEDGLARNTLASYRSDLLKFAQWLRRKNSKSLLETRQQDIEGYLAHQVLVVKDRARTTSRELSSLKRFFRFELRQGKIKADPTLLIDAPKLPRSLPKSLTEHDVESLLEAPEIKNPLGVRDKTMLETLYAGGLRVSELVSLKIPQVSLDMGVVRVLGKGSKERLV
ncbi:MAG TPA: tyrosine-type recombinase/integrase, partial [Burkholderiales bacterium]|nr:tyrosine-type recombinase/integrase [Burkholderiales bacterium]